MRPLEIVCAVLSASAALSLMIGRTAKLTRWLATGSLLACIAQISLEGAHWQIAAEYLAAATVFLVAFFLGPQKLRLNLFGILVLLLDGTAMVLSFLLPVFSLPQPTGVFPVGTTTLYFNDLSRPEDANPGSGATRQLKVQLWYPAHTGNEPLARYRSPRETESLSSYQHLVVTHSRVDAPVADSLPPFPVILYSPGWDSRRTIDTFLTEDLASHGYVVAAIDHPYNARLVSFPDGRVIASSSAAAISDPDSSTPEQILAIWNRELAKWEADERFVLDSLQTMTGTPGSQWSGRLDVKNAGALGHSFGGAASTQLCAHDARIHGAVNMDGWFFGAIHARGPNQPLLVMSAASLSQGEDNTNNSVAARLDANDAADVETSLHKFGGYVVVLNGANHDDFTDESLISPSRKLAHRGSIPPPQLQNIVRTYVLAFFDKTLRGKGPEILNQNSSPFKQVSFENWPSAGQAQQTMATFASHTAP